MCDQLIMPGDILVSSPAERDPSSPLLGQPVVIGTRTNQFMQEF